MTIFIALMVVFAITDYKWRWIPNIVIFPALILGCVFTGNWLWMIVMFLIGALLFNRNYWCGGDVKLLALVGAFVGIWALGIGLLAIVALKAYRGINKGCFTLPYAPFFLFSSVVIIAIKATSSSLQWCR